MKVLKYLMLINILLICNMPCNEGVSTIREVTGSKDIQEICDEVISKVQNKEYKNLYIEEEQHKI